MTVTGLGVIGTSNGTIDMALYTSVGGSPSNPLTETGSNSIATGSNTLLVSPVTVAAGTYWMMVEFPAETVVCASSTATNLIDYASEPYGTFPSNFTPTNMISGPQYNFYVVGN
jgi:hypothetical protein